MPDSARLLQLLRADLARLPPRRDALPAVWRIPLAMLASRGFFAVAVHRIGHALHRRTEGGRRANFALRLAKLAFLPIKLFSLLYAKISIPDALEIGPGLLLSDRGRIILAGRRFGTNLTVGPNVTAGQLKEHDATPIIGDDVTLEGDCVLFGRIAVGDGCVVAPGAALSRNVPPRMLVSGNPAVFARLPGPPRAQPAFREERAPAKRRAQAAPIEAA